MQLSDLALASPIWPVFVLFVAGVLGAVLGSFINCLAWRMVHGESVWKGRSHCATCGHELSFLDLIPILSWVCLRGTCRYCKEKVSPRYVVAEVLCAAAFVSFVAAYGLTIHAAALCILACVLLGLSLVDLDTRTIPNGFIIVGIVVWAATFAFYGVDMSTTGLGAFALAATGSSVLAVLIDGVAGGVVVAGGMLVLSLVFDRIVGRQSLGGGDVKLLFMVGLYLGLAASVLNLIVACIVGIVFAFATQRASDKQTPRTFPFGPSIALATWFTLLAGPQLLTWYFGLF